MCCYLTSNCPFSDGLSCPLRIINYYAFFVDWYSKLREIVFIWNWFERRKNETTFQCSYLSHALQDYGEKHKKNLARWRRNNFWMWKKTWMIGSHTCYYLIYKKKKKRSEKHDCTVRKININEFECKSTNVNCFEFVYDRLSKSSFQF